MPKYTKQIVVFLDILGFSRMLTDFEDEALAKNNPDDEDFHESSSLNRLLEIFQSSIELIKGRNCNYYLFSDNICITVDYITDGTEHPELFIEIFELINILNYEFVKEGYFLRGGIDVGWFLDSRDMAAGNPLVCAYLLESKVAVNPRVVISQSYKQLLNDMRSNQQFNESQEFILDHILIDDGTHQYINYYLQILNFEEPVSKVQFLTKYKDEITQAMLKHITDNKILEKYEWSARKFNEFIQQYVAKNALLEAETLDDDYLNEISTLTI